jgi:hypothetical protein
LVFFLGKEGWDQMSFWLIYMSTIFEFTKVLKWIYIYIYIYNFIYFFLSQVFNITLLCEDNVSSLISNVVYFIASKGHWVTYMCKILIWIILFLICYGFLNILLPW